jgi:hypothetical protein
VGVRRRKRGVMGSTADALVEVLAQRVLTETPARSARLGDGGGIFPYARRSGACSREPDSRRETLEGQLAWSEGSCGAFSPSLRLRPLLIGVGLLERALLVRAD